MTKSESTQLWVTFVSSGDFAVQAILKITSGSQEYLDGGDTSTILHDIFVLRTILRREQQQEETKLQISISQHAAVNVSPFSSAAIYSHYISLNVAVFYNCTERKNARHIPRFSSPSVSVRFVPFSDFLLYSFVFVKYCRQSCSLQWDHFDSDDLHLSFYFL